MYIPALREQFTETLRTLQAYQAAVNEAAIVSITDLNGIILFVNSKFTEISKYSSEELLGKTHRIINSNFHPQSFFRDMWHTISQGKRWRGEIKNKAKDGSYYWVDTVITPVLDRKGNMFQYLSIRNLITTQKLHEEELMAAQQEIIKKEQQLKDAQEIAKMGSWHMSCQDGKLEWSKETYNIFEIPREQEISYDFFLKKVHARDRRMVNRKWNSALKTGKYDIEHRIITPSGIKWVQERARFTFDASGTLVEALGTIQDITEKTRIANNLKESQELYKGLFNNSPFAIGILEKNSLLFLEVNITALKLYGFKKEEFSALSLYDIQVEDTDSNLQEQVYRMLYVEDKSIRRHRKKNGELISIEPTVIEMMYKGEQAYLLAISDVTEKMHMLDEIERIKINRQREIIEAQEESRSQIGREMHDNINQLLAASRLYLRNVHTVTEKDRNLIDTAVKIIAAATEEIRKLSVNLVAPDFQHKSLKEIIEQLFTGFELFNITAGLSVDIDETQITDGLKLNIFRITQELFNNIIKHSRASHVSASLIQSVTSLILDVSDDGKGFDADNVSNGIGLSNIRYRAETYKGKVDIISSVGTGCRVIVTFKLLNN